MSFGESQVDADDGGDQSCELVFASASEGEGSDVCLMILI